MNRLQGRRESALPPVRPDSAGSGAPPVKTQMPRGVARQRRRRPGHQQENRPHRGQIPKIPPQAAPFQVAAQLLAALAAQPPAIFAFLIRFIRDEGADNFAKPLHLRGGL